jgi:fumarate hydratase class I
MTTPETTPETTPDLGEAFLELVRRTATDLPEDIEQAIRDGRDREAEGSAARSTMDMILENVDLARRNSTPICQDTGTPIFRVRHPSCWSSRALTSQIEAALVEATKRSYLRPNAVDSITGANSGNSLGRDVPTIHFENWDEDTLQVDLMLKGGGCENSSAQYTLPNADLGAGRDLDGARKVVLHAAFKAQGLGCSPGVLGVAIGGDRSRSYVKAKEQLYRRLDEPSQTAGLAEFEDQLTDEINQLGIGPMGFGGETTVLGVQATAPHRHPASFFVTIAYMCWADRRRTLVWRDGTYEIS